MSHPHFHYRFLVIYSLGRPFGGHNKILTVEWQKFRGKKNVKEVVSEKLRNVLAKELGISEVELEPTEILSIITL